MPKDHPFSATEVEDKEISHGPKESGYEKCVDVIDKGSTFPNINVPNSITMTYYVPNFFIIAKVMNVFKEEKEERVKSSKKQLKKPLTPQI